MRERWRALPWRTGEPLPPPREGGWDGLRLGSEGCAGLVPAPVPTGPPLCPGEPERLSLVTPPLGPREFEEVRAGALAALRAGWREVVVNDWGLLDVLGEEGRGRLTAGRLLLRARRGPGESDPWGTLDEASRSYLAWGPLLDLALLDLLRDMGVSRLELDPPRHWQAIPEAEGFSLTLHADHRLVTLAGNCPFTFDPARGRWRSRSDEGCGPADCVSFPPILLSCPALPRSLVQSGRLVLEEAEVPEGGLPPAVDRLAFSPNLFPRSP